MSTRIVMLYSADGGREFPAIEITPEGKNTKPFNLGYSRAKAVVQNISMIKKFIEENTFQRKT